MSSVNSIPKSTTKPNATPVVVTRTPVSTVPTATAGTITGGNAALSVKPATISTELVKENLGDNPVAAQAWEKSNSGVVH